MSAQTAPEVLSDLIYSGRYTVAQIAKIMDCGTSLVYKYAEDERPVPFDRLCRLGRDASRQHGDNRLALLMLDPQFEVVTRAEASADGRIDDEVCDLVQVAGRAATAHKAGDRATMDAEIVAAEAVLNRIKAERDRLR